MLDLVLLQLSVIVPTLTLCRYSLNDSLADRRSGAQWLRAIAAYLEYKTGDSWRRLSDRAQRWDPERLWYVDGVRFIRDFVADTSGHITLASGPPPLPQSLEKKTDELRAAKLSLMHRAELVPLLMEANPELTDRKLLMHLSRHKLALMLIKARDANAAALERSA